MAQPVIGASVWQLPDFGAKTSEMGRSYAKAQELAQEKARLRKKEKSSELGFTQAQSQYYDNSFKLDPNRRAVLDVAYKQLEELGERAISGDQTAEAAFKQARQDFNQALNIGVIASTEGRTAYKQVKDNPNAYDESTRANIDKMLADYTSFNYDPQVIDGVVTVLSSDGKTRVPLRESLGFSVGVAEGPGGNSLGVRKENPFIKDVDITNRAMNAIKLYGPSAIIDTGTSQSYNTKMIIDKELQNLDYNLDMANDPGANDRRLEIATRGAYKLKGSAPSKEEVDIILNDPMRFKAVLDDYKKQLSTQIQNMVPAKQVSGGGGGGNGPGRLTNADVNELDAFFTGVPQPTADASGNVIIAPQNYTVKIGGNDLAITDLTFDKKGNLVWAKADFSGLPSTTGRPTTAQLITTVQQDLKKRNIYKAVGETAVKAVNAKGGTPK